jgi:hypothetical protein
MMQQQFKTLNKTDIERLQSLERELGVCLVALEPERIAKISNEQVRQLKDFEKETGTVLLAYRC